MLLSTFRRLLISALLITSPLLTYSQTLTPTDNRDTLRRIAEEEERRLMDPLLKRVPYERLDEARQQINRKAAGARTAIPNITWQERGPSNLGGRTRTLLFDPNDVTHKKVWIGSPLGGLWYTNDITDSNAGWTPASDSWENMAVTALAADPSNPQVMYAGTGDGYGYITGGGIWKTTNGGTTWARLSSTIPGSTYPSLAYGFGYIQRIVVNANGYVFAATRLGIFRSIDGGTSWQYVLAPNQGIGASNVTGNYNNDMATDLELASDGVLYASFNPSRVFKSTNTAGTTWTEITPTGASGGERTELALAPTTSGSSQVVYGVSRAYNSSSYGKDIKWFKKSTDGGTTWTDLTIPTLGWGDYFTYGNGYYALNLLVHPTDANTIYAGSYDWFRSINGGTSWGNQLTYFSSYQQGLFFQPGTGTSAALINDNSVYWSTNWGNNTITTPAIDSRHIGYRGSDISSVSMRSSPGDTYLLAGVRRVGFAQMASASIAAGNLLAFITYPGMTFIDEEDASVQISETLGAFYRNNPSGTTTLLTSINSYYSTSPIPSDYDSPSNTLYAADNSNSQTFIKKVTGVNSTPQTTTLTLTGVTNLASYLKLNADRTKLFMGTGSSQLYRITNLNQATPTVTAIDNGAFPQYSTISCIDVGATDDELLVTLSNFGIQSVWYTTNGGISWTGKDQSNYGLPDVPVQSALFNPQNRKQVLLGTDAGIWSTDDITTANPGWGFSGSGMGGGFRINQLRYRASDGRITAATRGRGVWSTDAFVIPNSSPTISIASISNTTLCAGNTFTVSFTTAGPAFGTGNAFEVWLSDATGSFISPRKIGGSTTSPVSITLPSGYSALPYGTNYQLKIIATTPNIESNLSSALAIGNLGSTNLYDRSIFVNWYGNGGSVCTDGQITLYAFTSTTNSNTLTAEGYTWFRNGSVVSTTTSSTFVAQQAGTYTVAAKQAGCLATSNNYTLYGQSSIYSSIISSALGEPQCDDHPLKIQASYAGNNATFQWTRDGVDIAGATSYSYTATQTGTYAHRVTDGSCSTTSSSSYFQFGRSLYANAYLASPGDSLICTGSNLSSLIYADVHSINGSTLRNDFTIQWYRNGVAIPYETYQYIWANQPGTYSFLLKQGTCQTFSNAVSIRVANQLQPSISYKFASKSACPGEIRTLSTNVFYSGNFQWQKDGIDIAGATGSSYSANTSGNYTLKLTRGNCVAISLPVSLTFTNAIQPSLTLNWSAAATGESCTDANPYVNETFTLSGYQYQWYRNGILLEWETYSGIVTTQSGLYSVRVTNGSCTGLSKEIYVSIKNGNTSKSVVTISPTSAQLCQNNSLLLTASLYMGYLQWKRNGVAIPGATSTQFYATQSGIYTVVNQNGSCTAESDPVEVKIGEPTTASLSGNALISSGQSARLPVSFTGPAPWSFTLSNGQSVTATYQNPTLVSVSPTSTTTYQIASLVNACGLGTVSGQASVSVGTGSADVALNMAVSNRTPNVGDLITYTLTANNSGPDNAQGVQLSSLLPSGLSFVSTSSPGVSFANGVVSANLGSILANNQSIVSFQATPTQPGVFLTSAQVTATQTPDPDSQPNSGTGDGQDDAVTVDIRTPVGGALVASTNPNQVPLPTVQSNQPSTSPNTADLSLSMWVDKETPTVSELVSASLTIANQGGSAASSIVVQVVLPNGSFSSQSPVGWIPVNSQTYKIYINTLAAGKSATVFFKWQPAAGGAIQAQILDTDIADPDSTPGNGYTNGEDDTATVSVRVR
ncbi:CARDB domain-containing protein [Spirosoma panaciterrae]|uniref:CARDB domain-containing protein n=1 Tax=Spirosoma panaciterrae TaxID=496058 RepID=UPI000381F21A|nr:CARDB domain-containing protein [Spirosoma panaciterrae]